jgi:hypothetical protein
MGIFTILFGLSVIIGFGSLIFRPSFKDMFKGTWGTGEEYNPLKERVDFHGNEVFIDNSRPELKTRDVTRLAVFKLNAEGSEIVFYENIKKVKTYKVESVHNGSNLDGWYLHTSIRITKDAEIQVKGVLSKNADKYNIDTDERIIFEPFTLSV